MKKSTKTYFRSEKSAVYSKCIGSGYTVKGEVWMEKDGRVFLDSNRINLLCLINKYGSLAAAARYMGLGYNSAWLWIMDMNRLSPRPLVKRSSGGVNGGYSVLTEHGQSVIREYNKLNSRFKKIQLDSVPVRLSINSGKPGRVITGRPPLELNLLS